MFIDASPAVLITGSGLSDYLNYKFYKISWKERKTYATIGYQTDFYKKTGRDPEKLLNNKINFLRNNQDLTKRDFFDPKDTIDNLKEFLNKHENFVCKPINDLGGTDIKKMNVSEINDIDEFYESLKNNNMFWEELIVQDQEWGKLSPKSINTIRVMTSNVNGKIEIFCMIARIGSSKNLADNFHQGGCGVFIDTEKGILKGNGINKDLEEFEIHPVSKIKYDNYKILFFKEITALCTKAAKRFNQTNVIGWDVAITDKGPLIVEGNNGPGFDLVQVVLNKGTKYMIEKIDNEINKSQKNKLHIKVYFFILYD